MSALEKEFELIIRGMKLNGYQKEFRFHPKRRWRFDFAWPDKMVAVELEGGTWTGGRHTRGKGFRNDCEKYNSAAFLGWTVIRLTTDMVRPMEWADNLERILE